MYNKINNILKDNFKVLPVLSDFIEFLNCKEFQEKAFPKLSSKIGAKPIILDLIVSYNNFLKQEVKLKHLIPLDDNNLPIIKPVEIIPEEFFGDGCVGVYDDQEKYYLYSKKEKTLLFKNFYVLENKPNHRTNENSDCVYYIEHENSTIDIVYTKENTLLYQLFDDFDHNYDNKLTFNTLIGYPINTILWGYFLSFTLLKNENNDNNIL